jgi:hypothetical protein
VNIDLVVAHLNPGNRIRGEQARLPSFLGTISEINGKQQGTEQGEDQAEKPLTSLVLLDRECVSEVRPCVSTPIEYVEKEGSVS